LQFSLKSIFCLFTFALVEGALLLFSSGFSFSADCELTFCSEGDSPEFGCVAGGGGFGIVDVESSPEEKAAVVFSELTSPPPSTFEEEFVVFSADPNLKKK